MTATVEEQVDVETRLCRHIVRYKRDPLGFVQFAWPWGKKGTRYEAGLDANQIEILRALTAQVQDRAFDGRTPTLPILITIPSGHGTGKSVLFALIAMWVLSCWPESKQTVTAGSWDQLVHRTAAAITAWGKDCITAHWFDFQKTGVFSRESPEDWKLVFQSCKEENAQNFAGQHAARAISGYIFDEASEVPPKIWETAYGGMTDGMPIMIVGGQMLRSGGEFFEVSFGER